MKTVKLSHGEIVLPESIYDLNIRNYNKFQFYIAQSSQMGNEMSKVKKNFEQFHEFQKAGKHKEASEWVNNAYYSLFLNSELINPLHNAFAVLSCKPNELTEDAIRRKLDEFAEMGLTHNLLLQELSFFLPELERNLNSNLD